MGLPVKNELLAISSAQNLELKKKLPYKELIVLTL